MDSETNTTEVEDFDFDAEEIGREFDSEEKVNEAAREIDEKLWEKVERVGKKISFKQDIKALYAYMTDTSISWYRKAIVIGALIYFITPVDAIPDISPLVGYLDDLGVITAVLKYLGSEIMQYYSD